MKVIWLFFEIQNLLRGAIATVSLIKNPPRFLFQMYTVSAQGYQPPLKLFSTKLTSRDWAGEGRSLKILLNGSYILDECQ